MWVNWSVDLSNAGLIWEGVSNEEMVTIDCGDAFVVEGVQSNGEGY